MDIKNRIEGEVYFVTDTVVDWIGWIYSHALFTGILSLNHWSIARKKRD